VEESQLEEDPAAESFRDPAPRDQVLFQHGDALFDPSYPCMEVGHLEGWGRGLYNEYIFYQRSRGSVSRRSVSIPVQGRGKVRVRAKGLRVGEVVQEINIG